VYLKLHYRNSRLIDAQNKLAYCLTGSIDSYNDEPFTPIDVKQHLLAQEGNFWYLQFKVAHADSMKVLWLQLQTPTTGQSWLFDISLKGALGRLHPPFVPMEPNKRWPWFANALNGPKTLMLRTDWGLTNNVYYCYYYSKSFPPALPPMSTTLEGIGERMQIDSFFTVAAEKPFELGNNGLYYFQSDSSSLQGTSILQMPGAFPRYQKIQALKQPLQYISTSSEWETLNQDSLPLKKAFDQYWLTLMKSPDRAKVVIKNYYRRVTSANYYFTSFKEGWKTDRGMIYILFGPPDLVLKSKDTEEWLYKLTAQAGGSQRFTFKRVDNIFAPRYFALKRQSNYRQLWFDQVRKWRRGPAR